MKYTGVFNFELSDLTIKNWTKFGADRHIVTTMTFIMLIIITEW